MSPEPFDRLARAAADADHLPFTRRTAVKLAAFALVATTPFRARSATAAAPAGAAQAPNQACLDCKQRAFDTYRKKRNKCGTFPTIILAPGWCLTRARMERFIDEQKQGCFGPCPSTPPPTAPQGPEGPQGQPGQQGQEPTPPTDECLNCMRVGGKCCPPIGPLCVCANPDYLCSRYGCAGD